MKKLVVVMLMFMLTTGMVFAEKGDIEVGIGYAGIPSIYGSYEIIDRIVVESELGYLILEESDPNDSKFYELLQYSMSFLYNVIDLEKHTLSTGLLIGHKSYEEFTSNLNEYNHELKSGIFTGTEIKYNFNFNFGLTIGLKVIPGAIFLNDGNVDFDFGGAIFAGWKF